MQLGASEPRCVKPLTESVYIGAGLGVSSSGCTGDWKRLGTTLRVAGS